ncbi:MAG TPA: hypothetical protein VJA27_04330 [Patescibacteria group bacterium]|nr:hypothetical protein [Patescibacteria group bacterium]
MKKFWKILLIVSGVLVFFGLAFYGYDVTIGQKREPTFFAAPRWFCDMYWKGITLPPVGMFVCEKNGVHERLRAHELVHWEQYRRTSTVGFYTRYFFHYMKAGFSYTDNAMEVEAREKSN